MMASASIDWTPDAIQRLRILWAEGLSTAAIGVRMNISKNAVVGKAHRLKLPARLSPIRTRDPRSGNARASRMARVAVVLTPFAPKPIAPHTVPLRKIQPAPPAPSDRPRTDRSACCWPNGEPGRSGFGFCGRQTVDRRPYCEEHCDRAYIRKTSRRDSKEEAHAGA